MAGYALTFVVSEVSAVKLMMYIGRLPLDQ
jgi:hypothetical protein